jgi:hypothetical protein
VGWPAPAAVVATRCKYSDKFVAPTDGTTVGSRYWAGLAGHTCCCLEYILGWTGRLQLPLLLGADIVLNCPVVAAAVAAGSRYWAEMAPAGATSRNKYCAKLPRPSCCCCWEQALCWAGRSQLLLLGAYTGLGWAGRPQLLLLLLLLRCDNVTPDTKIGGENAVASHHFSHCIHTFHSLCFFILTRSPLFKFLDLPCLGSQIFFFGPTRSLLLSTTHRHFGKNV